MRTEARFVFAFFLMFAVLMGTNRLFPPPPMEDVVAMDSVGSKGSAAGPEGGLIGTPKRTDDREAPAVLGGQEVEGAVGTEGTSLPVQDVVVEGPLYRYVFTSLRVAAHNWLRQSFSASKPSTEMDRFR